MYMDHFNSHSQWNNFMEIAVMCLYITGHLDTVFPGYRKEILRYLYCHQNENDFKSMHLHISKGGHSQLLIMDGQPLIVQQKD
ncbi:Beta-Amyrin Synthase 1 [Vitis vinifera]|uniref:Beta-Amyrin Synthase 1 n=1 Tax=Vitis vinifera TaxID=29760 RepID=A0A438CIW9_VITVI|nr:Beta-Amyrin Synthase 1 [Vitis vinifera]